MQVKEIAAREIVKGMRITQFDTPEGPFYEVVKVNAKSIVVDANEDPDDAPLPVRLPVSGEERVLVAVA